MIAACIDTASVVGIQAVADVVSPSHGFGSGPQALAALRGVLLEGDGVEGKLYQMRLQDFGVLTNSNDLGNSPNHIVVDDPGATDGGVSAPTYLYVVNSLSNNLQILQRTGDVASGDAGFPTVATLSFGDNSAPQAIAKLGNNLYIPLNSGVVAEVDVSTPSAPVRARTFNLPVNLMPFDAGVPTFPRPLGIAVYGGTVYVALRNLDAAGRAGGPGFLARLNLSPEGVETVSLPNTCLTAYWLGTAADAGNTLYVSCNGRAQRDDAGHLTAVDNSGAVAISADGGMAMWSGGCDAGVGCFAAAPGRFAVVGSRLYLGDELGRIFVLENVDGGFVERRGYNSATGGLPISACSTSVGGFANVNDVIAVP